MDNNAARRSHDPERFYKGLRAAVRFVVWTLNNLYCIPVYFCWLLVFQPLKWFTPSTYWLLEGALFRWLLSMVALWSYSAGYNVVELGDDVWDLIEQRTLVLFNHQSTSDVPLIMAAFNSRPGLSSNIMWIMDHVFKLTNFGVVSWAHGDFFIHGGKDHRDASLLKLGHHLHKFYIPRKRKWLVLFPEGGFLKNRKPGSQRYALKNNLPLLENVALPRVGALKVIMDNAAADSCDDGTDRIKYLLDVTVAYPGGRPLDLQTIFGGWRPSCDTIFHYRRFNIEEIPREEEALKTWLYTRYEEKEVILQEYYETGIFPDTPTPHAPKFQPENVRRLTGARVVHDPLEFILRHCFFLSSTYSWISLLYFLYKTLCQLLW
ncbi:acyl-CoA:lysophosphatidylglycerol acyltransferase 1 [Procambarus clarkii]|uniref:acyl-CoA:lysophosphatidylglycerol acyltransferase 1 n=1 Tax=Procambarus clarkii TaxID=6728 RepID=UPI001E67627F|nr:acyl-CoA:lysophosphatidylglycerol acyltransferase 1-like [Procambarus clarkii]XP_045614590.1 acyl-CoA:lysophosphatidylglycerol acyltransferase 1-like [Procambarus clarkii]XP_045614591.1 acyl-CoA:lysophosphatidylglycerol acyltransferase 1-like [Procambarus clarkii]